MTIKNSELTDAKLSENVNIKLQQTPIAVIGVAGVFPDAKNVDVFWDNIINEVDSITEVPPSRWNIDDYYDPDPKVPDKSYSKWGGFIPEIDFNPMDFGLPPNILEVTDVSQLLALVIAKNVLDDAGYGDETTYDRSKIGVTLGVGGGQKLITPLTTRLQYPIWKRVLTNSGVSDGDADIIVDKIKKAYIPWEENSFPGMLGNVIAGRVANRLNLGGTNCVLDAACASSLIAIKLAVSDLLEYRSEIMISGGVDTDNSPFMYLCFSKTPAFTPGDKSRPFDIDSKGMLVGEGIGMVALKRLEDAERDHDRIYAVLKGIGTSSDGKYKSIYAPRPEGQAKALNQAYEIAGISPKTMGLIEAHGTGTVAGDHAEFIALNAVFGKDNPNKQHIALGSVKSQIGHTKAAAGSAGIIKASLALYHKVLPATINVDAPHPKMDIENTPFYINSQTRPWFPSKEGYPRRAGISSFGFGGTNFHVVLEEYSPKPEGNFRKHTVPQSVIISGSNRENLLATCRQVQQDLASENIEKAFFNFVNQYKITPVKASDARLGFVCSTSSEALELINLSISTLESKANEDTWEHPKGIYFRDQGIDASGQVVALFSGQGSQYLNMGKTITMNFPPVMDSFSEMDKLFVQDGVEPLSDLIYPIPKFTDPDRKADQAILQKTENVQPAIGAFSSGLYKLLTKSGFVPDYVAGHSFGELTALWAAEILNDEDYFFLARARGKAMAPPDDENFDAGTMSAVMGDVENLESELTDFPDVVIANHNSRTQVVIAGPVSGVLKANDAVKSKGYTVVPLSVSAAFHTPLVGHAQKPFAEAIRTRAFNRPKCKVYSNSTGNPYPREPEAIQKILEDNILNSVLFKDEIENIYKDGGRIFVEVGPKNVLTKLTSNILADKPHVAVALNPNPKKCSDTQLRQALVQLCVTGVSLDDIDIYREISVPEDKKPGLMNIRLNGSNYVSDKTRKAYEDALNDGHEIKQAEVITKIVEIPENKPDNKPVRKSDKQTDLPRARVAQKVHEKKVMKPHNPSPKKAEKGEAIMEKPHVMQKSAFDATQVLDKIEQSIGQFFNHQGETLKVHSQQINNAKEYTKSFYDLMGQQFELLSEKPDLKIPESIERSMDMFHNHQGETLKVHARYLENQAENSVAALEFMKQKYGAEIEIHPTSSYRTSPYSKPEITVKSPVPRIEQRTVQEVRIDLPKPEIKPEPVKALTPESKAVTPVQEIPVQKASVQESIDQPKPIPVAQSSLRKGTDLKILTDAMLDVVADKTGYPTEMLELDMDMEADLGIDSIKRVEILAAVMDQFPELPEVNPDELAPLKTLAQIVEKLTSDMPEDRQSATIIALEPASPQSVSGPNIEILTTAMLSVVADKTGYPTEMLELDMDMEADLGIDSIKRVEILAAVMDQFPELPEVNPDELAPLKTLGQIVDKLTSDMPEPGIPSIATPAAESVAAQIKSGPNIETLTTAMLSVVADKTGYPTEMLELDMDMEADLGIDSIKRVEILAAVMDQFPELPEVNPDELAPLKTLGQIVDKLTSDMPDPGISSIAAPAVQSATAQVKSGPNVETLTSAMLSVVAEKTGYPSEMLELDMDMEADLGIDSIKRVEILAAVMDQFPELPEVNPDELAPLKTLGQIVDKLTSDISQPEGGTVSIPETPSANAGIDVETLTTAMLSVVAEKTGYPSEMLELDMDMEADLGIDSIKRVEILAAVMDQYPELPDFNPDELSALKTLGEVVNKMASASGSSSQSAETESPAPAATPELKEETKRSIVKIQNLPKSDFLEFDMVEGEICLITDDGTQMTAALGDALDKKGWKVVVLSLPKDMLAAQSRPTQGIDRIVLKDIKEETLETAIKLIQSEFGPIGGFIHLNPGPSSEQPLAFPEKEKDILQHVFLMAKHLKAALVSDVPSDRRFFMTIARLDGKFGLSGEPSSLIPGGLFGLSKTLKQEWPSVFCRAVDIDPGLDTDTAISAIVSEIHDPDCRLRETAHGPEGRITLVSREADVIQEKNTRISNNSVFLVSGGAKGVTAKCVAQLAADHPCKFILMGRSEYADNEEPAWAKNLEDEAELKKSIMMELKNKGQKPTPKAVNQMLKPLLSNREIRGALHAIHRAGATAEYISADVTDENAIRESLAPVLEKFGAITGIIHGAGVLADKLIENKNADDFNAVYSTKINGLKTLLNCVDCSQLTHLALFSSAAGFYGNEAQADYAMANEILNKTAYRFKTLYPDCHVNTFNWGPWDGGMVTPELKRMFAEKGVDVIPVYAGSRLFTDELSSTENTTQILVGGSMIPNPVFIDKTLRSYKITRNLLPEDNLFLNDHVIGENPVLPTVCASWWMADTCEKLYPGFRFFSCADYKLFKGIVFDNSQSKNYIMDIKEISKNDLGEAEFDVKIMSRKSDGKTINHYGATITLINRIPEIPVYDGFDGNETHVKQGSVLYQDGTLFHGPNFQAIEKVININQNKVTMECRIPEIPESDQGQFRIGTFNPFAADPQFQIMLIWVRHHFDAGSLPTKAQLGEHFARIPKNKKFFVSLDVTDSSPAHVVADITTHDEDGRVYTRVKGAEVTISKQLNSLFVKAS